MAACSAPGPGPEKGSLPTAVPRPAATATASASAAASAAPVAVTPSVCPAPPLPDAPKPTGERAIDLSMGMERACAVLASGALSCWGGQYRSALPEVVAGVTDAVDVAVVGFTQEAFVARKDGSLVRVDPGAAASQVAGFRDVVEVAAGTNLVAVRTRDGSVSVTESIPGAKKLTWKKLPVKGARQVAAGGHVCAIDASEQVACFTYGERGLKPYPVAGLGAVKRLFSGGAATCATRADGTTRCFGVGQDPSLTAIDLTGPGTVVGIGNFEWNDGPTVCRDTPEGLSCKWLDLGSDREIPFLRDALVKEAAKPATAQWVSNGKSACRRDTEGRVSCWGYAGHGLLGEPDPTDLGWPVKVPGVEGAVSVASGSLFMCALLQDGHVMCWGSSDQKAGVPIDPKIRVIAGLEGVTRLLHAGGDEVCAVKGDGSVSCFGGNPAFPEPPVDVPGLRGVREMAYVNGRSTYAVIDAQGQVLAQYAPAIRRLRELDLKPVEGMPLARSIFGEDGGIQVIAENGQVWAVTVDNAEGTMSKPKREPSLDGVKEIGSDSVFLWSDGKTSRGDPRTSKVVREAGAPPLVSMLLDGRGVRGQPCGVIADGTVVCQDLGWGAAKGLPKVKSVDTHWDHTCAVDVCGGVYCWGNNWAGQCGVSGESARTEPRPLAL